MKRAASFILPLLLLASCAAPSLSEADYRVGGVICKHPLSRQGQLSAGEMAQVNEWLDRRCTLGSRSIVSYVPAHRFRSGEVDISRGPGKLIVVNGPGGQYAFDATEADAPILRMLQLD